MTVKESFAPPPQKLSVTNTINYIYGLGCEYKFGIYPFSSGCQQTYIQCSFGEPTQVPLDTQARLKDTGRIKD